ncbi:MAG: hypothetical protein ACR2J5_01860 [Geodermatophilaceae bacterium]
MMDRLIISTHLQDHLKRGERLPLTLRLEIKRTVEEARNEWRKWDRLDADPGMRNIESDAHRAVLGWIRILRLHVMDWTGRARCRRRRFGTCNTCTLLFYLCRVFMNPSKPSQYAAFERRLLSSAATVLIWVIILASVSGLLSNTRALNDLADTAVVGIFVAVTFAVYASLGMFVKETVELLPYDSPPFLPLWFDNMNRIRLRRRRALLSVADSVLDLRGATPARLVRYR